MDKRACSLKRMRILLIALESIEDRACSLQEARHAVYRRQSMPSIEGSTCSLYEAEHTVYRRQGM